MPAQTSTLRSGRGPLTALVWLLSTLAQAEPLELSRQLVLSEPPVLGASAGWSQLPPLRKGSKGAPVAELNRLIGESGLVPPVILTDERRFDRDLERTVITLQKRFGLKPDGIAGPQLYANLEHTLDAKRAAVEAFAIRLEHLAHEARQEGRRKMVVINVPSFTLRAIDLDSGKTILESPVIVGRKDRQTPIGRLNIVALITNPIWKPPPVVMKHDILPKLGKDPKWWEKHPMTGIGPDGSTKPGQDVTPEEVAAGWKFVQPPGKENALGLLKFETDSKENIYLHDTSERALFANPTRTHSSGCVRVQKWQELAAFLSDTTVDKIGEAVEKNGTRGERIPGKVPVFIEYSQGDVINGNALYFPDIYARNVDLDAARENQRLAAKQLRAGS